MAYKVDLPRHENELRFGFRTPLLLISRALGEQGMPIYPLLQARAFDPDHCRAMGTAFEAVLQELGLKNRSDPLCHLVARTIIEQGERGERDPKRLEEFALATIRE